jgi:ribosomal protein S18 acetylase RimI-like enzyme
METVPVARTRGEPAVEGHTAVMTWTIRSAAKGDAEALSELAERTFRDAFAALNTPEDMDLHCERHFAPSIQAREIVDPATDTLVVEHDEALVAFAQVRSGGHCQAVVGAGPAIELLRIYVDRRFHGTGLARDLMNAVLARARDAGARTLWLGVWERNPRAIAFYERFGFSAVGEQVFTLGSDPQRDLVMVRSLDAGD